MVMDSIIVFAGLVRSWYTMRGTRRRRKSSIQLTSHNFLTKDYPPFAQFQRFAQSSNANNAAHNHPRARLCKQWPPRIRKQLRTRTDVLRLRSAVRRYAHFFLNLLSSLPAITTSYSNSIDNYYDQITAELRTHGEPTEDDDTNNSLFHYDGGLNEDITFQHEYTDRKCQYGGAGYNDFCN
jgi:hypothetical protein